LKDDVLSLPEEVERAPDDLIRFEGLFEDVVDRVGGIVRFSTNSG